jgi:hypothetical protein
MDETPKEIKIKLTNEQLLEKQVQLEKSEMQLEIADLNKKHFERMIKTSYPMRQAEVEFNNLKKQIEIVKHNVKALKMQIDSGEM